jgi:hypothetical protein
MTIADLTYLIIGLACGILIRRRNIPFFQKKDFRWAIGIYTGDSPLSLSPPEGLKNPVLTARDVTDIPADFVADPFMVRTGEKWHMFFEAMNARTGKGEIGLAESDNGLNWRYRRIVLNEPFHLSYPYVFEWESEYYMIPEAHETNSVRLYKAIDFPNEWKICGTLLKGYPFIDSSVIHFDGRWWMFTAVTDGILHLYSSDSLFGPWILHPQSPLVMGDCGKARPGGRVIALHDKILRFAQDSDLCYGSMVRAFEVTQLTTAQYSEREVQDNPVIRARGSGWNAKGMHTVDSHQTAGKHWVACVDGYREGLVFGFQY